MLFSVGEEPIGVNLDCAAAGTEEEDETKVNQYCQSICFNL